MLALKEIGEDPQVWSDLAYVHGTWTWDALQRAPEWVASRAILWADVLGAWNKAEMDRISAK
jgi:hypothetical protein